VVDFGKLFGKVGGGQVGEAFKWVTDNKDTLGDAIEFIQDLDDHVVRLLKQLPDLLDGLGSSLADAGEQAQRAALTLVGDDGKSGAQATLSHGAGMLGGITEQLGKAAATLADVAEDVGNVGIPSIEPQFTEILGLKVISGVDIETNSILAGPAGKLKDSATTVGGVTKNLGELADDLDNIADVLGKVGEALGNLGGRLGDSGSQIKGVLGP
jgi:hypothetical protein